MKCSRCNREIAEDQTYSYQEQAVCDDCLMDLGLHPKECEPWASYLAAKERKGLKGTEGLTDLQKKVYQFIKDKGKVTREEVQASFKLSEAEMDEQLTPLQHSELVKEHDEKDAIYLITIA